MRSTGQLTISANGGDPVRRAARYCAFCGRDVLDPARMPKRFGEVFCSEDHADEFGQGVRRVRVATAGTTAVSAAVQSPNPKIPTAGATKPWDWKMALKMAACCAGPMLALVMLAGGGGALLGAAGAVAPVLLALACPLGMIFMMWSMARMGKHNKDKDDGEGK